MLAAFASVSALDAGSGCIGPAAQVHVRLEYLHRRHAFGGIIPPVTHRRLWADDEAWLSPGQLVAPPLLGYTPPESPFLVEILEKGLEHFAAMRAAQRGGSAEMPTCGRRGDYSGYWAKAPPAPDFLPPVGLANDVCPHGCADAAAVVCDLKDKSPGRPSLLRDRRGRIEPWLNFERWRAHDCDYPRFDQSAGEACLAKHRIVVVGDSVAMQECNFLQRPEEPCFENQGNRSAVVACVSPENFFGPLLPHGGHTPRFEKTGPYPWTHIRTARWNAIQIPAADRVRYITEALERHGMGPKSNPAGVRTVLLLSIGLHDAVDDWDVLLDSFTMPGPGGTWGALLESAIAAGIDRVVWQSQVAIHKYVADTTNCSEIWATVGVDRVNCIRSDYDPKIFINNPRVELINTFVADVAAGLAGRGAAVDVLDAWAVSQTREDHTLFHSDQTHPCDDVYRELLQILLHLLCPMPAS
eukprot:SM000085S23211  [mRNA]  locus=s85:98672:101551:+ [translate_table: standard]